MNWSDLNSLELKDIVSAPAPVKWILVSLGLLVIIALGWYFVWADALSKLESARNEEVSLKETYTSKKTQAYHYDTYKQRLAEIEKSLGSMLRQLPNRAEMDALLTDINQVGVGRGLDFLLFKPGSESPSDFYAMLPVSIKVKGSYHDIGQFVSDVGHLPRIVTLHDVSLIPEANGAMINMEARVQTYRYLDEEEIARSKKIKQGPEAKKANSEGKAKKGASK